jgi:FixJ family two-component response regulator
MPGINGKELADRLRERRPSLKVVFMSGYADEAIAGHGVLEPGVVLIQKPLTPLIVATRIRDVLDGTVSPVN